MLAAVLTAIQFTYALVKDHCMYMIKLVGMGVRSVMMTALYRSCLSRPMASRTGTEDDTGKLVNQMASDANRFLDNPPAFVNLWSAPIIIFVGVALIWSTLGPAIFVGLAIMSVGYPILKRITRWQKRVQREKAIAGDLRLKFFHEAMVGIKVLKFHSWERCFQRRIESHRWNRGPGAARHGCQPVMGALTS